MSNDIRILLGSTDLNLTFDPNTAQHFSEKNHNGTDTVTWNLLLTYATTCDKCGNPMVNNGTKTVIHKGPRSAFNFQNVRIRRQKFLCKKRGHTSIAQLSDIKPNNHIIHKVKQVVA